MEVTDVRFYVLAGILTGIAVSLIYYYLNDPRKKLADELVRCDRLHALRFAAELSRLLQEKELMEAYARLRASRGSFCLRQSNQASNRQEAEEIESELLRLENYLSVLEIICFAVGERVFERDNLLEDLDNRLHDLNRHPDVCRYLEEYAGFYKHLNHEREKIAGERLPDRSI